MPQDSVARITVLVLTEMPMYTIFEEKGAGGWGGGSMKMHMYIAYLSVHVSTVSPVWNMHASAHVYTSLVIKRYRLHMS